MAFSRRSWSLVGAASYLLSVAPSLAAYPPTPEGITVVDSALYPGASVSYKETHICETSPDTKAYSGYINLPPAPSEGRNYEVHTFFWFFEARNNPQDAPLSMWLQGGPGVPSVTAALGENGPCYVTDDSKGTELNSWSWNDKVNMLYIDQPVQVGFSYDTLANGTINEPISPFLVSLSTPGGAAPKTSSVQLAGTFASQNVTTAPNNTITAATAMWHFMQLWMQEFPEYKPQDNKFSIWTESYGGHYGPTYADFFDAQNERIASGTLPSTATPLHLDTLGIVNGCIDINTQMPLYPEFGVNNTYGVQVFNESSYKAAIASMPECRNQTDTCRTMTDQLDPQGWGNNTDVNTACKAAYMFCFGVVAGQAPGGPVKTFGGNVFEITAPNINSFPSKRAAGYLNMAETQQALGVPVNFTGNSFAVAFMFDASGDFVKGKNLAILGNLLDRGVKVAMMYGDRDFQCNWFGGEAISLAIQSKTSKEFSGAGYANIETNGSYVGGLVRQYGNLSFSRVFQAGHEVPAYQPETAYQIFNRVMFNTDVATGKVSTTPGASIYASEGPESAWSVSAKPAPQNTLCYLWDMQETCTPEQAAIFSNGSAITKDFVLIGYKLANGTEVLYDNAGDGNSNGNGANGTSTTTSPPGPTKGTSGAIANAVPGAMVFTLALIGLQAIAL